MLSHITALITLTLRQCRCGRVSVVAGLLMLLLATGYAIAEVTAIRQRPHTLLTPHYCRYGCFSVMSAAITY